MGDGYSSHASACASRRLRALAKLLLGLRLPASLAADMAATMHFEPRDLVPCLSDPGQLPSVMEAWAESDSFDAALADLSESVRKLLRELVEERVTKPRKLRKAAFGAVESFDFEREDFDMLVKGQLASVLKRVMTGAAAGALDALTREKMQSLILELWKKTGKTIIVITHSVEEALLLGERLFVMAPRPGRIHREYHLPFAEMGLQESLRGIKQKQEFSSIREEILTMIWDMEEEIMGGV